MCSFICILFRLPYYTRHSNNFCKIQGNVWWNTSNVIYVSLWTSLVQAVVNKIIAPMPLAVKKKKNLHTKLQKTPWAYSNIYKD